MLYKLFYRNDSHDLDMSQASFMPSPLGFFWLFLALAFFVMAWRTYKLRQVTVPKAIEEAHRGAYFAGDDVAKLRPIFFHEISQNPRHSHNSYS
jgi:hypothetical protein